MCGDFRHPIAMNWPRPVQPGFEDAAPGMVPSMKEEPGDELQEEPGGRFAKQLADLPEEPDRQRE